MISTRPTPGLAKPLVVTSGDRTQNQLTDVSVQIHSLPAALGVVGQPRCRGG